MTAKTPESIDGVTVMASLAVADALREPVCLPQLPLGVS